MTQELTNITGHTKLVRLAREIAVEQVDVPTLLQRFGISGEEWQRISANPRFSALLQQEMEAWNGVLNTHERVKLKAATLMEEWLMEGYARMVDPAESLNAKTELAKLMARLAGMGLTGASIGDGGSERFSVTINIGERQVKLEQALPSKVIEGEAA